MKETPQNHSLPYFLASLAGIARALEDFGYRDEANDVFCGLSANSKTRSCRPKKNNPASKRKSVAATYLNLTAQAWSGLRPPWRAFP